MVCECDEVFKKLFIPLLRWLFYRLVPAWYFRPAAIHYNIIDLWKGGRTN